MRDRFKGISSSSKLLQFSSRKNNKKVQCTVNMNKWSLLLFSVIGLLLLTTSEPNFVDGRLGCCDRSSGLLLSDTRLSIYEPDCANTFTEIRQLTSPKRDIRYAPKNLRLKRSSRSEGRRGQFEVKRIYSEERFRVFRNDILDLEDSSLANERDRKALREINDSKFQRILKSFSRDNYRENHVDRSYSRNENYLWNEMERNSLERGINVEEKLSEVQDNRFGINDRPVNVNIKSRQPETFTRRAFVIRINIMPNSRENIGETRLRLIQKKESKREMERSNLDINTRRRLLRDTRLSSELSRNSDSIVKKDDRSSNARFIVRFVEQSLPRNEVRQKKYVTMQLTSKIGDLKNENIRDYRRQTVRQDSIEKLYERESLTDVRRNTNMDGIINEYRRSSDENIPKEILARNNNRNVIIRSQNDRFTRLDKGSSRPETIYSKSDETENRIRDDKRQMINDHERRLFQERYSTQRVPRHNINGLKEIRQAKLYNDRNIVERTERVSDQRKNRNIRDSNRKIRLTEEYTAENKNSLVEKRAESSKINNRRSEAIRHTTVLERRERDDSRYRLNCENGNIFDERRIRQIRSSHDDDKLREARNTQRRLLRNDVMGQEINNIKQIYNEDDVFEGTLVRDNNRILVSRLKRQSLTRTGKRACHRRVIQREDQNRMHNDNIQAMNIQERLREDSYYHRRFVSNSNRNVEKRQARSYNKKSVREEFKQSPLLEAERAFDESRIRQARDNQEFKNEFRLNVQRTDERVLTRIDRNRNNVVERDFLSISSIGKNRIYEIIKSSVVALKRREHYEVRHWTIHENERNSDQRRTRDAGERREDDLSNERLVQRNLARMKNVMLNNNRRNCNDKNNSEVTSIRNNDREIADRSERERFSSVNKRSAYHRMIQRQHENGMRNDYRQPTNIPTIRLRNERNSNRRLARQDSDTITIVEYRRTETPDEKLNTRDGFRNILVPKSERSFDESRNRQLRDSREYRLNKKLNAERVLILNANEILEKRESRIQSAFDVNRQNKNTKRTPILLPFRKRDEPSLMRLNERDLEQSRNGIVRNREFTRIEAPSKKNMIVEIRGFRNINERSNTRDTRNKVNTRYVEIGVEFHDSEETHNERRTERDIRNIGIMGRTIRGMRVILRTSINNRDLLEARSQNQRDVNRELEYIRYVRSYNGLEKYAHRENKDNVKASDRENNRERDNQVRARNIRISNGLQISKDLRLIKTRRIIEEEREIRTAFSKIRYLPIEHKPQTYNQMFEMELQYIFYLLQGLYILGLFTKFTKDSKGNEKRIRFSNWFPLSSTLKID